MEYGENTTYCAWRLLPGSMVSDQPVQLKVKLLANARDFHGAGRPWDFNPVIEGQGPDLKGRTSELVLAASQSTRGQHRQSSRVVREFRPRDRA
jgi:hypothetical protein